MPIDHHALVGLQRAEFAKAARLQKQVFWTQLFIAVVSGVAVFVTDPLVTYLAALAVAASAVFWAWLAWAYRASRAQAERARRATLLMDGLGEKVSSDVLLELEARFSVTPAEGKKNEDRAYYAAASSAGDVRLAEMLEESAFWSCDLMRHSAQRTWLQFFAFFGFGLFILALSLPFADGAQVQGGVRVFCSLLTLLVSTEVLGAALAYDFSHHAISRMNPRLRAIQKGPIPRADLLLLLSDYNSAVEGAPMYPPGVYESRRDRLNELWLNRSV